MTTITPDMLKVIATADRIAKRMGGRFVPADTGETEAQEAAMQDDVGQRRMATSKGRFIFEVTQPPGKRPPIAGGQCVNLDDAMREAMHFYRVYAQDGGGRVEVYEDKGGGHQILHLMFTAGRMPTDGNS